jgi:hypothetical protein
MLTTSQASKPTAMKLSRLIVMLLVPNNGQVRSHNGCFRLDRNDCVSGLSPASARWPHWLHRSAQNHMRFRSGWISVKILVTTAPPHSVHTIRIVSPKVRRVDAALLSCCLGKSLDSGGRPFRVEFNELKPGHEQDGQQNDHREKTDCNPLHDDISSHTDHLYQPLAYELSCWPLWSSQRTPYSGVTSVASISPMLEEEQS